MLTNPPELELLRDRVGAPAAVTAWERFDQATVNAYAAITGEELWIHTDPDRAHAASFGGTIVQASLLMARFGAWLQAVALWLPDPATPLNYGYDRIRIPGALRVGEDVRGQISLKALRVDRPGMIRLELRVVAEAAEAATPILVADWLVAFMVPMSPAPSSPT